MREGGERKNNLKKEKRRQTIGQWRIEEKNANGGRQKTAT